MLNRAIETTKIGKSHTISSKNIQFDWRLNERHWSPASLNKSETATEHGEDMVQLWRRSYDISPPLLDKNDKRHPKFNKKFHDIDAELPAGESLKDVIIRLQPFLDDYFEFIKNSNGNHLIVAHSNSLRAIIKILDNLNEKEIVSVNIPTGVPLIYSFGSDFHVTNKEYLINEKELQKKQEIIKNQGKAN